MLGITKKRLYTLFTFAKDLRNHRLESQMVHHAITITEMNVKVIRTTNTKLTETHFTKLGVIKN